MTEINKYLETLFSRRNVKALKRKTVGFCGSKTILSEDKLAEKLLSSGVVTSLGEGRNLVPLLDGKILKITGGDFTNYLSLKRIERG